MEACVQILNKYERFFTKERQEPSGYADAFTLTCMFVCLLWKRGILQLRFMLLHKEPNIIQIKNIFPLVCFLLVRFSATYGSRNVNRSGKNGRHDSLWRARFFEEQPEHREIVSLTVKARVFSIVK